MAKKFQPTFTIKAFNAIVKRLLAAGVKVGPMTLLTVTGRKTGVPRTLPVAIMEYRGERWLMAPYGAVSWVQNVRAAGKATLSRGRRHEVVRFTELPPREAAPIIKEAVSAAPSFLRAYFDVTPQSPLEDFEAEAPRHPVFHIQPAA